MFAQLTMFEAEPFPCDELLLDEALQEPAPTIEPAFYLEQASLDAIMPARYLQGLDSPVRWIIPFECAIVVVPGGQDVLCQTMRWGSAALPGSLVSPTRPCRTLWSRIRASYQARRCVVIASRFGFSDAEVAACATPSTNDHFYLAAHWCMTPSGPAFTLIERRADEPIRRFSQTMPILLDERDVWPWLMPSSWSRHGSLRRDPKHYALAMTRGHSVDGTPDNAKQEQTEFETAFAVAAYSRSMGRLRTSINHQCQQAWAPGHQILEAHVPMNAWFRHGQRSCPRRPS